MTDRTSGVARTSLLCALTVLVALAVFLGAGLLGDEGEESRPRPQGIEQSATGTDSAGLDAPQSHLEAALQLGRKDPLEAVTDFNSKFAAPPEGTGDPDLGRFDSMFELQESARTLAMTFAKDGDWVAEQMAWQVEIDGTTINFDSAPLDILCPPCNPPAETREDARELDWELTRLIEDQANYSHGVLNECVLDYVRNKMQRVERRDRSTVVAPGGPPRKKSRYEAITSIHTGRWTYVIEFRSCDYPELETALEQLVSLKTQRKKEIVALLGG